MARKPLAPPPKLNAHLETITPYPPGKPIEEVQREFGLDSVIKLASNENPLGPSPRALKAMAAVAHEMGLYPDGAGYYLKEALAARHGVSTDEIILGNGSDELTQLVAMAYLNANAELVTSRYSFIRYLMAAQQAGAPARLIPMNDMRHDLKALAGAIDARTAMICLDLPCNPTGTSLTRAQLRGFLKKVPAHVIVVADQAYFEFAREDADYPDALELRGEFANLVVMRTFSKAYGLAGLRIGYAVARPEIIAGIDRVRPPFNANRMAQAAALAALGDEAHLRRTVAANARGREMLAAGFAKLGLRAWPSWTNFILVDMGRPGVPIFNELLKLGVVTRPMAGYGLPECLRISVGTTAENRRCLAALKTVLQA